MLKALRRIGGEEPLREQDMSRLQQRMPSSSADVDAEISSLDKDQVRLVVSGILKRFIKQR